MLDVRVLGPIEAHDDGEVVVPGSRAQRVLLAALAHARGRLVPSSQLAWLVWGDELPAHPQDALKSHMSRLRRSLGADVITGQASGYALTLDRGQLDVHRFERGLGPAAGQADLEAALGLWRGRPYGEVGELEHFAGEVARLTELHAQGRLRRADLLLAAHRNDEAAAAYTELVAEEPLREAAWTGLLRALHAAGRQAEATARARRYRELLRDVGLDPAPRHLEVEREVFTTPSPAVGGSPGAASLPTPLASLVGRDDHLEQLDGLLRARRLVTLTGPGGVGKTALALRAAQQVANELTDAAWMVPLAEVDDPGAVVPAMVRAVGAPAAEPLERSLERHLAGRRVLLVLDNAEHVLEAVRLITERLLSTADATHVLVTSRQPLELPGEAVLPLPPLDREAASTLLHERARDAGVPIPSEHQELAIEVCDRLDRLPLAIEMAAARLRGLGLEELAARLDERLQLLRSSAVGRHGTLAAVVGWSYDLLDTDGRSLLEQLSVFAGAFELAAAAALWDGGDVAGSVADLVDRSLLQRVDAPGHARYQLLETVRSFAAERLAASGAADGTVDRFVRFHAELAERVGAGLRGPDEQAWADTLERELPNLEAAHAHALRRDDVDAAVVLASSLYVAVYHRLRADIGAWAETTLARAQEARHPGLPEVAAVVAVNRLHRGELAAVEALLVDLPDDPSARHAHEVLGDLHVYRGGFEASVECFRAAERLAERAGDSFTVLHSRMSRAMALGYGGDVDEALTLLGQVRRETSAAGIGVATAWCDFTEAELVAETQPQRALDLVDRTVADADRAGWRMLAGVGRLTASSLRARTADPADAIPGFERLIRHWARHGDDTHQWTTLRNLVDLFIRLEAYLPAARLLGAVSVAPRPTFGAEKQRLGAARDAVLHHLAAEGQALIRAGTRDDLPTAVELALTSLRDLRRTPRA
jgi:predicted ATPase/DNA-binding SARP family transcriptional activator